MSNDIPVKEISELLDAVSGKVPQLISGLIGTIYSEEAGRSLGKAVGAFYKEITASGIPADVALKMTTDYMISLKDVMSNMKSFTSGNSFSVSS